MKLVRLFLMSGLAVLAFSGVAAAAEGPSLPTSSAALATPVSTAVSAEGTTTTYSDGMELFTPVTPDGVSDCLSGWFCLWETADFGGQRAQWQGSGMWQAVPSGFGASSFYNDRGNSSRVSGAPGVRCFPPGGAGNFSAEWNDQPRETFLDQAVYC